MASDATLLSSVGQNFVIKTARVAAEAPFYGVYLILMYMFMDIFRHRSLKMKRSLFLAAVVTIMFLGCSCFFAMDVADLIVRLRVILVQNPEQTLAEKMERADNLTNPLLWTGEMLFIFLLTLGDSVVVWRTWALYQDQLMYLVVPCLTLTASFVTALYELGCDLKTNWAVNSDVITAASMGAESCRKADTASYSLSFATNIICTGLIICKAWLHKRFMSRLGSARRRTQVDRILLLFCESGAVYLVLYTLQAIPIYGAGLSDDALIGFNIVNAIIQQAMGMYPTTLVVLCHKQKSLWEDHVGGTVTGSVPNKHMTIDSRIQFARPETSSRGDTTMMSEVRSSMNEDSRSSAFEKQKHQHTGDCPV